ncbi:MAG: MFS transporter [Betaproteobacteria bacterium]
MAAAPIPTAGALLSDTQRRRASRLRWTSFSLLIVAYMLGYFHRMAPAVLSGDLQTAFHTSGAALGVLAASYFYAYTLMQIPSGVLADIWGPRRSVTFGALLAALGALAFGLAESLWIAGAGRFLIGLGASMIFIAILKLVSNWFYEHQFATVTGLTILLGNLGGLTAATPLSWSLEFASWRSIMVVLAAASGALGLLVWLIVRDSPREMGLPSMRELEGRPAHAAYAGNWRSGLLEVLKNPATWPGFFVSMGLGGFFFTFAGLWAVPFLRDVQGFERGIAAHHGSLLLLGFAMGSMFLGFISDRLGRRRPPMFGYLAAFGACWAPVQLALPLPTWLSLALYFMIGFFATGYTITLTTTKETNPPALSGMATSVVNAGVFLGAAILQPLVGGIMDYGWDGRLVDGARLYSLSNYQCGFAAMSAFVLMAFLVATRVRETYCRHTH